MIKKLDYFFVLRPILFFPGWSTLLAGYFIQSNTELYFSVGRISELDYIEISLLLFIFMCAMGASFLLNQLCDIESDLKNKKLFLLSENHISRQAAAIESVLLISVALLVTAWLNLSVFFATFAFIFITGYVYNFKPFVFKDRPIGSLFANAFMGWLAFAIGWSSVNAVGWPMVTASLPYLFFNTALYFYTTLPDIAGDKASDKATLSVRHGKNFVINMALVCYILSLMTAIWQNDLFALLFIVLSLPFFIIDATRKSIISTVKTTKYALLFFALAICLKFPFYLLLMIASFAFTKWYFKMRFNYDYPNFKGV